MVKRDPKTGCSFLTDRDSIAMDTEGSRTPFAHKYSLNGTSIPIFRKHFYAGSNHEHTIVSMIHKRQKQGKFLNLIRVLNVHPEYYDAELLDTYYTDKTTMFQDILENLNTLHGLGIIYVDIKDDNMGYSHLDKKWKLFDFDASGISNKSYVKWIQAAPFYYNYKLAYQQYFNIYDTNTVNIVKDVRDILPLTQIDTLMYDEWKKDEINKVKK